MSKKLAHPFPGEPFTLNAFLVLFGPDALRKRLDAAPRWGEVADPTLTAEMHESCADFSGATVEEVKEFLAKSGEGRRR